MNRDDVFLNRDQVDAFESGDFIQTTDGGRSYHSHYDIDELLEAQLKKLVEWGEEICVEHFNGLRRFSCWACCNELKKLAGVE